MPQLTRGLLQALQHDRNPNGTLRICSQCLLFCSEKSRHQTLGSIVMYSLKLVVPPQPTLPSTFQHAQLLSDVGHEGHEQQINDYLHTRVDGVLRRHTNRPATPMAKHPSKVDVDLGKQGPSQDAPKSRRESTLRTILTVVSDFFKRPRTQSVVAVAAAHPEIDQLRREITVLQNRCANLEEGNYSVYGSCRSSTLDILQGLRKPDPEILQSIVSLSEDSESRRATTNEVVQANVETNDQALHVRQGLVPRVPAGAEGHAESKDVDLAIHPAIPPRSAKDEPSTLPLDQNQSGVIPATRYATAPVRVYREEGLSETDKPLGVQFSQTGQQKLPRKKKEDEELDAEVMVEVEAQSGYRLPRKKRGNEELEVDTLPPHVHRERLPRKKESEESEERDGGRSG